MNLKTLSLVQMQQLHYALSLKFENVRVLTVIENVHASVFDQFYIFLCYYLVFWCFTYFPRY